MTYYWQFLARQYSDYVPELTNKNLVSFIKEEETLSIKAIIKGIGTYLFYELLINSKLLGTLIVLILFSTVLQSLHGTFEQSVVSKIAYFVVFLVLIHMTLNSFYVVFHYAKSTIEMMSSFMLALIPLLLSIIATSGQLISVTFFHPLVIFLVHISGVIVSTFVFPLLYLSALLMIVSFLSERYQATQLATLFRTIALGTIGLFMTVFLGVMSVQGTATAFQDGIVLKTTKFLTGNFIPVVGRTITDATDTVLSATILLKNTIGIVGLTIIVLIAVFPAVKIAIIAFIYRLAAALLQPLGDGPVLRGLQTVSTYMLYVLACVIIVTCMFFLAIVIIIVASNVPLLLA